jgi:acetolactate synthase-1/3 small subunit
VSEQHAFSLYLNNRPGVLNRVALVFSRRGWNIENISISPAEDGRYARCNLVAMGPQAGLTNVVAQLNKLVDVIAARNETIDDRVVSREVVLIKVRFDESIADDVSTIANELHCDVVDTSGKSAILQFVGEHAAIDQVRQHVGERFEVIDVVRSGAISMHRMENDEDDISNVTPGIVVTAEPGESNYGTMR